MTSRIRKHLLGNLVAYLALFVALGGSSYAAVKIKLPAKSVGSAQLKNKAVTPAKVAKATVPLFKGAPGDKGDRGDRGTSGLAGVTARTTDGSIPLVCVPIVASIFTCNGSGTARAGCAPGERAISGSMISGALPAGSAPPNLTANRPDPETGTPTGWLVSGSVTFTAFASTPPATAPLTVRVVCAAQ